MNQETIQWVQRQPKAQKAANPDGEPKPSPLEEAMKEQQQVLAEGIRQDTYEGARSRSEQLKLELAAGAAKAKADLIEQERRIQTMQNPESGPEGKKKRMFSVVNGEIIPDPEGGDFEFAEALKWAAQQREQKGPVYYVQNPETGQYSEVRGPVIIPQPMPPQIYKVDNATGEVEQVEPGVPLVVKQQAAQQKNWLVRPNPDGSWGTVEVEPGMPVIIPQPTPVQQQAPVSKNWMVRPNPDGTWTTEEIEPGKPIIIQPPSPPASPSQPSVYQLIGPDGKPFQLTKEALDMQITLLEHQQKMQQAAKREDAVIGFVTEAKQHIGTAIKAGERAIRLREKRGSAQPAQAPQGQVVSLECKGCGATSNVMLRAIKKAGNQFQCSSCGEMNQVEFEEAPAPPAEK